MGNHIIETTHLKLSYFDDIFKELFFYYSVAGQQQFINVASPAPNSIYGTSEGGPYTPATPGQPVYAQEP